MSITLMQPNRAQQTWYMDVDFPELGQDGYKGVKDELTDALNDPNALQTLKGYALDRGVSQFTIKWYCTDGNHPNPYTMTVQAK